MWIYWWGWTMSDISKGKFTSVGSLTASSLQLLFSSSSSMALETLFHTPLPHSVLYEPGIAITNNSISPSSTRLSASHQILLFSPLALFCFFYRKPHLSPSNFGTHRSQCFIRSLIFVFPSTKFLSHIPDKAGERILVWWLRTYHQSDHHENVQQATDSNRNNCTDANRRVDIHYGVTQSHKNRDSETCSRLGTGFAITGMYHPSAPSCEYCRSHALFRGSLYRLQDDRGDLLWNLSGDGDILLEVAHHLFFEVAWLGQLYSLTKDRRTNVRMPSISSSKVWMWAWSQLLASCP